MHVTAKDGCRLQVRDEGPREGRAVVFANSLGTDLRIWDDVVALLPSDLRIVRFDLRGHGGSDVPEGPYAMGTLVSDAEAVMDGLGLQDASFVGLSIGGMIGQALAVKRPDLVARLVLSNTAAKIGTPSMWADRIAAVREGGLERIADAVIERWFGRDFRAGPELASWRARLLETPAEGYAGCCAAIAGTDLYTPTSGLRLPVLAIAGSEDGATPPDLVRETATLVPASRFEIVRRAGHLPCVERPGDYARLLAEFV